jgi:hypothetical protein
MKAEVGISSKDEVLSPAGTPAVEEFAGFESAHDFAG